MRTHANVVLLAILCAGPGPRLVAQTNDFKTDARAPQVKPASEPSPKPPLTRARKAPEPRDVVSTTIAESLENFVVGPGKSLRVFFNSDFGGASRASFSVYADPSVNLSKVALAIWWAVPGGTVYAVQDVISGGDFYYSNTGGANVPVYGTAMFVDVINNGTSAIPIQQLSVYAVAQ